MVEQRASVVPARIELDRRLRAIVLGAVVTVAATAAIWHLPSVWPTEHGTSPFKQYRLAGGLVGGFVAGLLAGANDRGWLWGGYAAAAGGVVVGAWFFLFVAAMSVLVGGFATPPLLAAGAYSFFLGFPLVLVFVFGGALGGFLGRELRLIVGDVTRE